MDAWMDQHFEPRNPSQIFMPAILTQPQLINTINDTISKSISNLPSEGQIKMKFNNFNSSQVTESSIDLLMKLVQDRNISDILRLERYSTNTSLPSEFSTKASMYKEIGNISHEPSIFEQYRILQKIPRLSISGGLSCRSIQELLAAYELLTTQIGHTHVVIKDAYGCGGNDIFFYGSKQEIVDNFRWKDDWRLVIIEEDLNYPWQNEDIEWYAISYYDDKVVGNTYQQILRDNKHWIGSQKCKDLVLDNMIIDITNKLLQETDAKHTGGFDFAVRRDKVNEDIMSINLIDMDTTANHTLSY